MSNQQGSPMVNQNTCNLLATTCRPKHNRGGHSNQIKNQSQNWQNQPQQQWVNQGQSMPVRPTIQSGIFCQVVE